MRRNKVLEVWGEGRRCEIVISVGEWIMGKWSLFLSTEKGSLMKIYLGITRIIIQNMCAMVDHGHIQGGWSKRKFLKTKRGVHLSCFETKRTLLPGVYPGIQVSSWVETTFQATVSVQAAICLCDATCSVAPGASCSLEKLIMISPVNQVNHTW